MIEQLRQYLHGLEQRERHMVLVGAGAIAITLLYLLLIEPLLLYRDELETRVERQRDTVAWMQGTVGQLAGERSTAPANGRVDTGSLLTLVDTSARNAALGRVMQRVQQDGDAAVRVRFENAGFDALLLWLGELQQGYGVSIDDITVERAEETGRVDASITLSRGDAA